MSETNAPLSDCPERSAPGPTHHEPEEEEQPEDMDVFWVLRCSLCGAVFDSHDTEQEYLENEFPEIHNEKTNNA